jgi:hypothetical protein
MTVLVACDFEGTGPAGTVLSNANTGGTMSLGAGATAVSASPAIGSGAFCGQYDVPAANVSSRTQFALSGGTKFFAIQVKFQVPLGFATTKRVFSLLNSGAATVMSVNLNGSTGQLQVQNSAGAATATASDLWANATTYRVELVGEVRTSVDGIFTLNFYVGDGLTPVNVTPLTRTNFDMAALDIASCQAGIIGNGTSVAAQIKIDSIRYEFGVSTMAEIGPEVAVLVTPTVVAGVATVPAVTFTSAALPTPTRVAGVASVPAPSIVTPVPAVRVLGNASIPVPTITTGSSIAASVVAGNASVPVPTLTTGASLSAVRVQGLASIPAPTITGATVTAEPAVVAGAATIPVPSVGTTLGADIQPVVVRGRVTIPYPVGLPETPVAPDPTPQAGSWYGLLDIYREAAAWYAEDMSAQPVACPNDGEPLLQGPRGELYCPFDGWQA